MTIQPPSSNNEMFLTGANTDSDRYKSVSQALVSGTALSSGDIISPFVTAMGGFLPLGLSLVVNETLLLPGVSGPKSKFPFNRLAWVNANGSTAMNIYHQLNESLLAEETYVQEAGWIQRMIPVPTA